MAPISGSCAAGGEETNCGLDNLGRCMIARREWGIRRIARGQDFEQIDGSPEPAQAGASPERLDTHLIRPPLPTFAEKGRRR